MDKDKKLTASIERQKFQMTQKGLKEIADAIKINAQELSGQDTIVLKAKKGDKGDPGHTPTEAELVAIIKPLIPAPIKGKDAVMPTDKEILALIKPFIPIAKDGETPTDERLLELIRPLIQETKVDEESIALKASKIAVKEVKKIIPEEINIEDIIKKLQGVKKQWVSIEAIKGDFNSKVSRTVIGGGSSMTESRVKEIIAETPSGASTFIALTDVPQSYAGQGSKVVTVKADATGLEFTAATSSDEKVKYDANDTAAGYLGAKTVAGTGISLAEGTAGDADKLVITNSAPDQIVALTAGTHISSITGTYPNFTINAEEQGGTYTLPTASSIVLGGVKIGTGITIDGNGSISNDNPTPYTLPTATGSVLGGVKIGSGLTMNAGVLSADTQPGTGTVTSVAALTIGTTGTDLSSTVADGTTTPVITLQVPTASATNRGALSAADWATFNGKQPAMGGDDNYVTDAQLIVIGNTSGTNTGDNAVNSNYSSLTQYTDEMAQDAVGGMVDTTLTYTDGTPLLKVTNPVTPQTVGFTIAAGTTPKTLTVALDASVSGTNTGDAAANSTANTYADGKVADAINDGTTTIAPSQNAVFDALALKAPLISPSFTTPTLGVAGATSINKITVTAPATGATLTIVDGATLTASATASVSGTNTGDNAANTSIAATKLDDFTAPDDNTDLNATTSAHGLLLKATAPAAGLISVVAIGNGETAYTNKALFDATVPSTQAFGDAAATGSATVSARRDHKHAMPATTKDTTAVTGILKGNGSAISAASAGTDYLTPITVPNQFLLVQVFS